MAHTNDQHHINYHNGVFRAHKSARYALKNTAGEF